MINEYKVTLICHYCPLPLYRVVQGWCIFVGQNLEKKLAFLTLRSMGFFNGLLVKWLK